MERQPALNIPNRCGLRVSLEQVVNERNGGGEARRVMQRQPPVAVRGLDCFVTGMNEVRE
eukprot:scaffold3296_cov159-Ochromonas_danica.AAC.20